MGKSITENMEVRIENNKIWAPLKNKWLVLTPEEKVRQEYIERLKNNYGYSYEQMLQEVPVAEEIRNNLDAHKNQSFTTQISFYKKCDWSHSIVGLSMFTILIEKIQIFMEIIHHKIDILYNQYRAFMEDRMRQYEEILRQIQEYKEPTK